MTENLPVFHQGIFLWESQPTQYSKNHLRSDSLSNKKSIPFHDALKLRLLPSIDPKSTEFAYLNGRALVIDEMNEVGELLIRMNEEMDRRKKVLENASCVKISKYLDKGLEMPFITLIIDEWADVPEDVQNNLWRLLRMGRFVGIHVVAATQRPSSKVFEKFGDLKAMFLGRLSFVVADVINSSMILDSDEAAYLPAIPGRAIYKCGLEKMEMQTLFLDPNEALKLYEGTNLLRVVNPIESEIRTKQLPKMLPPR